MSIEKEIKNNFISKLTKLTDKETAESIDKAIYNFCNEYTKNNDTPYLLDSVYETKITEILSYLEIKNSYLLNAIKNKEIKIEDIPNMNPDQLNPEQFADIKKKQQIKEAKSNSKKGTAAFPCPKCKKSNSKITERQMRSGDEPPTIFVTCLECKHTHKLS
jgi:DNA-directed RNA polymerase subunit M/transcription elongation factor TFIIS